jgi:hypothetical protein
MPKFFSDEQLTEGQVRELGEALDEAMDTGVFPAGWFQYLPADEYRGSGRQLRVATRVKR